MQVLHFTPASIRAGAVGGDRDRLLRHARAPFNRAELPECSCQVRWDGGAARKKASQDREV